YAKEYLDYLKEDYKLPIKSAYLFGSLARGKARAWSDVDVCIVSSKFKGINPLVYLWTKRREIDVERGIEPVGIHPKDFVEENPIAHEVKKFGVLLRTI
ncbi:nucleotidyltransferase domain-containing protein, partial [Candidatus Parcubacteria bacterium]|nr:nucleotidyltransferase domain-containing protein [Candidatus Parcubacteria bacterium]